jgi:hypothetical protein
MKKRDEIIAEIKKSGVRFESIDDAIAYIVKKYDCSRFSAMKIANYFF